MAYTHRRRNAGVSTPFATWNAGEEISSSRRLAAELWHLGFDEISAAKSLGSAKAAKAIVNHAGWRVKELEAKNRSLRRKANRLLERLEDERSRRRCCRCDVAAAVMTRRCAEERRGRVEAEAACAELLRQISGRNAEADSLRMDLAELEEEHRAVQLAEAWREERVQMKLADARLALDDGFAKINYLVSELRALVGAGEISAARELLQSAAVAFGDEEDEERRHNVSPASAVVAGDRKLGSPENPHIARGMSGCVEWPRGRAVSKRVVKAKILNLNQRLKTNRA